MKQLQTLTIYPNKDKIRLEFNTGEWPTVLEINNRDVEAVIQDMKETYGEFVIQVIKEGDSNESE